MDGYITIGVIIKAQGIKGEIKVRPLTDDSSRFFKLKIVYISGIPYRIRDIRIDRFVYLKLDGVDDRNAAQEPDRKHRPKFVDYFIKKNSDNK